MHPLPSILMTSDQVAVMHNSGEVVDVFKTLMDELKKKEFDKSEIVIKPKTTQLSDNQGIVVGAAKRFDKSGDEIEYFGFTYTLRKVGSDWKIIAGVLHKPDTIS
jgi:uncharacterized protein YrzB (UPF0473 family)